MACSDAVERAGRQPVPEPVPPGRDVGREPGPVQPVARVDEQQQRELVRRLGAPKPVRASVEASKSSSEKRRSDG